MDNSGWGCKQYQYKVLSPCLSSSLSLICVSSSSSSSYIPPSFISLSNNNNKSVEAEPGHQNNNKDKRRRKHKPSFYHQIREKWSVKPTSLTNNFPWQQQPVLESSSSTSELVSEFTLDDTPPFNSCSQTNSNLVSAVAVDNSNSGKECNVFGADKIEQEATTTTLNEDDDDVKEEEEGGGGSGNTSGKNKSWLPWNKQLQKEREKNKSNTELADKLIPQHELNRLRNVAFRMKHRLDVGAAGVTQALIDAIHRRWQIDEVVKLKFQRPSASHMKRIHHLLQAKTKGLVIWRSGTSVVLFRGLSYKLHCVHSYNQLNKTPIPPSFTLPNDQLSMEFLQLNNILDDLGPRYADWSGPPPLPVDADLLPPLLPHFKTPFRLLPYGVRRHLTDHQTTLLRRDARITHPHFALGRNTQLHGLAAAILKLWEKSAIAKIAIKRGVFNTCNDRMADDLKRLTGGTLLSRNKEYIVFYRGNDFLPPHVTESLKERERMTMLQYQEEEERRSELALVNSNSKNDKAPMVAGTLAETVAATSRWGKKINNEDAEKMIKDSILARRASLVTHLKKKLAISNAKLKQAEKALEKVHGYLEPEELPTDLETITDEERLVYRKMGLSMKPYLLLGRREVFDGTIENIHLHWKFRELVKVIAKGKSFGQVKHVAISLEAESGGVLVSIDKTTKGYVIIIYRGKNYRQPLQLRPRNLLTRRQALARSIELQRREGLKHHIASLREQMELLKSDIQDMNDGKVIDDKMFHEKMGDAAVSSNDDMEEDVGEEAYLQTYDSEDENGASYILRCDED